MSEHRCQCGIRAGQSSIAPFRYFKSDGEYVQVYRAGHPDSIVAPEYWSNAGRCWESSSTYDPACLGVYEVALDVALPEITEAEAFAIIAQPNLSACKP